MTPMHIGLQVNEAHSNGTYLNHWDTDKLVDIFLIKEKLQVIQTRVEIEVGFYYSKDDWLTPKLPISIETTWR